MPRGWGAYLEATRHPWMGVLFVLPWLAAYEAGLYFLGPAATLQVRNGADIWLRAALARIGISPLYGAPVLLLSIMLVWCLARRHDRPRDCLGVWVGMTVESVFFALALYGLCQALWPFLDTFSGMFVQMRGTGAGSTAAMPEPIWEQVLSYLGAGIYEETLFRLVLFSALLYILRWIDFPGWLSLILAAAGSALLFAGAHHLGPHGEAFHAYVFLFRTLAGLYFAAIFHLRGFGVAVGAHTIYDVLVGLLIRPT